MDFRAFFQHMRKGARAQAPALHLGHNAQAAEIHAAIVPALIGEHADRNPAEQQDLLRHTPERIPHLLLRTPVAGTLPVSLKIFQKGTVIKIRQQRNILSSAGLKQSSRCILLPPFSENKETID